jgi:hypothetical protein
MADNYYDGTGVLVLDTVTPIIQALFGGLRLDADYPGNGQAYIARIYEGGDAFWDDIRDNLDQLAEGLGLPPAKEAGDGIAPVLRRWATHFGVENHERLNQLIGHHDFEDTADLESLFLIATCFDDGHGLKAIALEAAWHCSKPRLFEFGGEGLFISREVAVYGSSGLVQELGNELREALVAGKLEDAAATLLSEVNDLLAGIAGDTTRQWLQDRLAHKLLEKSGPPSSPSTA